MRFSNKGCRKAAKIHLFPSHLSFPLHHYSCFSLSFLFPPHEFILSATSTFLKPMNNFIKHSSPCSKTIRQLGTVDSLFYHAQLSSWFILQFCSSGACRATSALLKPLKKYFSPLASHLLMSSLKQIFKKNHLAFCCSFLNV